MGFWDEVQKHGGITGRDIIDPWVRDPSDPTGKDEMPNPNPKYKYTFADGTHLTARAAGQPNSIGGVENPSDFEIVDWGTAAKKAATPSSAGSPISAPSSQRTILMQYDDGTRSEIPNPNYVNPQAQPDVRQVGNNVIQRNPTTGQWDVVYTTPTAPREPTGQLTEYQKWQIANYGPEQEYARGRDSVADLQKQQEREAGNLRQLSSDYTSAWREALKYRTAPGTEYIPGFEPGGLIEDIQKRRGRNYNADPWRTTTAQFDPWRAALDTYK